MDSFKISRAAMNLGLQIFNACPPTGFAMAAFYDGELIAAEPKTVLTIGLAFAHQDKALYEVFAGCSCEGCKLVSTYPPHAIAEGLRKHTEAVTNAKGRYTDDEAIELLLNFIAGAVER